MEPRYGNMALREIFLVGMNSCTEAFWSPVMSLVKVIRTLFRRRLNSVWHLPKQPGFRLAVPFLAPLQKVCA
jgi:hypothetical protein